MVVVVAVAFAWRGRLWAAWAWSLAFLSGVVRRCGVLLGGGNFVGLQNLLCHTAHTRF